MDLPTPPCCPVCGFEVFNRRYPRCESCGTELPETIVYSPDERLTLQTEDDERAAAVAEAQRQQAKLELSPVDAAVMSGVISLTRDG
jgi:hypothetical protein